MNLDKMLNMENETSETKQKITQKRREKNLSVKKKSLHEILREINI